MANTVRVKRRAAGGAVGAPTTLANAELAFNEADLTLYYGFGTGGAGGSATSVIPIAGSGGFVDKSSAQTIDGAKTFSQTIGGNISGNAATATTLAVARTIALSGDVTGSTSFNGSGNVTITAAITPNSVVNADLAQVATATLKGRATAGTGNVEDLTASQVRTILNVADGATNTPLASTTPNALGTAAVGTSTTVARSDHVHAMPSANQLATNAGDFSLNGFKATNLADPVNPQDAATKAYVDAARAGLDVKNSVKVATTANITLSGTQTIDGISVVAGDRVLVKNQSTASTNGIYVVAAGAWTRSTDADTSAKVTSGMYCFVEQGTTQADTCWVLSTDGAITLGTTSLSFTQFTGVGALDAGAGLTKSGNQINVVGTANRIVANADSIDIAPTYAGQTSITTLGTIATGSWQANIIGLAYGGTGANLSLLTDGAMLKKVGSALVAAVADTDYLTPDTVIDGGTF